MLNFLFGSRTPATPVAPVPSAETATVLPPADNTRPLDTFAMNEANLASALARPTAEFGTRASQRAGRIPTLPASSLRELIALSDASTVKSKEEFAQRIEQIDALFVANQDPRGAFSSLYKVITNQAVQSVQEGRYDDNIWGADLITDFGELYLENLHAHLTGGRVSAGWRRYYELADNPNVSLERVASVGATVHLVVDLPNCLARIGTGPEREDDFMRFGEILLEAYPQMLASGNAGLGFDMSNIFGLFFVGDIADALHGEGTATRFGFQTIRTKAWAFGQWLQDAHWPAAKAEISISWRTIDGILANLDAAKAI